MRKIKFSDFKAEFTDNSVYLSLRLGEVELAIEPCLDGYDCGIYEKKNGLLFRKIKAHHDNPTVARGLAIDGANRLWKKYAKSIGADIQGDI